MKSFININDLFNKCLLKNIRIILIISLVNAIYHNINYNNNILINTEDIFELREYIKYIIVNEDYIKLGIVFNVNDKNLFIPLNFLKHNINYSVINNYIDYKYIYSNDGKKFIHTFEETKNLVDEFLKYIKWIN